jgi:predicted dehydrogenase
MSAGQVDNMRSSTDSASRSIKIAFLGGAYDSAVGRVHRTAIEMDRRYELVCGCFSRNVDDNISTAKIYGIDPVRTYRSLSDLLKSEKSEIDAVVVMTPQDQHGEQVLACLKEGVPVICEKALVPSVSEAETIKQYLSENKCFLAVTYNYTGYPILRELKYMVDQGKFGKVQQIHVEMPQEGFAKLNMKGLPIVPQNWRLSDYSIPTISLDLGIHLHMIVKFLTGELPEEVVSISNSYGNFGKIIDNVSCLAKYSNNVSCSIWYSKTAIGYRNGLKLRLFGEKGSAEWVQEYPENLHLADNYGSKFLVDRASSAIAIANQQRYERFKAGHPAGFIEAFANYYYDIADTLGEYISSGRTSVNEYVFGIDESLEGLRMLDAIAKSSITKRWEKVVC